jgi:micrococcal nuclease
MKDDIKSQKPFYRRWWFVIPAIFISFPIWPFIIGGFAVYKVAKGGLGDKTRYALITLFGLVTLFIGSAWASAFLSNSKPSTETPIKEEFQVSNEIHEEVKGRIQIDEDQAEVLGETEKEGKSDTYWVSRVIDGDTIEIEGGQKIRYIGIDTPESVHPDKSTECYAIEASNKNKELVAGKQVRLEKDVSETDKYGRLLRYVYVGDVFVNDYLVREGYANAVTYPPDVKYQDQLGEAERVAREASRGLWNACGSNNASTHAIQPTSPSNTQTGCLIKGNISYNTGEKIYHVPGQQFYEKTKIDTSKGERWFCSEGEAVAAGWRKAKR